MVIRCSATLRVVPALKTRLGESSNLSYPPRKVKSMNVCLWDTRRNNVQKDFAGGMGVGMPQKSSNFRENFIRRMYLRDYRPTALNFAYLVAVLKQLGHTVCYSLDEVVPADVYIFNPALLTLGDEMATIRQIVDNNPKAKVLVVGQVAFAMAESISAAFEGSNVIVLKGEPEQLLYRWDEVLASSENVIDVGVVADLDRLPMPDWSLFRYADFRIMYDFWRFPTTFIQQSRGCTFKCNYCPYIMIESKTRFRSPDLVQACSVFDRDTCRHHENRDAQGAQGSRLDQHHDRDRDARRGNIEEIRSCGDQRRPSTRFHYAMPRVGHSNGRRFHGRIS